MLPKKKNTQIDDIEIIGKQEKKSAAVRQEEIQKTGNIFRVHKQATSRKTRKASL